MNLYCNTNMNNKCVGGRCFRNVIPTVLFGFFFGFFFLGGGEGRLVSNI